MTPNLRFAKILLDQTALTLQEIAVAAGLGDARRLAAEIRKTYKRSPAEIRQLVRLPEPPTGGVYLLSLSFRRPFDWDRLLAFLSPRAIPGVESVNAGWYRRTISLGGSQGRLEAFLHENESSLGLRILFPEPRGLYTIVERARQMFDLEADAREICGHLKRDPLLAQQIAVSPGLRVPGCWDGFELAVRAVLGQQVTVKGASTLAGRLIREFGTPIEPCDGLSYIFPLPDALANADLARIGLPAKRAETIRQLAAATRDGRIAFNGIQDLASFRARLLELPGIGDWTAQYVAMRAFRDADAFPAGDLGLLRAAGNSQARELENRSQAWRPWRAYAAMYLWQSL